MDTDVLVVGAGPTGLMLACELRLGGADVILVEKLPRRTGESRAGGLHSRTLEVLDQRGILGRFLERGEVQPVGHFSGLRLEFEPYDSRHPLPLMILQSTVEQLLEEWALELGVQFRWSSQLGDLRQDDSAVVTTIDKGEGTTPTHVRSRWIVGCDGGRSTVRKRAGIGFPGTPSTMTAMIGDVELPDLDEDYVWVRRRPNGDYSIIAFEPGWYRVITSDYDAAPDRQGPATFEQLRESLARLSGTDYGMRNPRWVSRFGDAARQVENYRSGRVLLAGDAAHIHYPAGGQGLNLGVQDAVNLGWKLAAVVAGKAPQTLLDTYHVERHPVAARVLHNTRAQLALARPGPQMDALRDVFGSLIAFDEVNRHLADQLTGLDIRYPMSGEHPLIGRRIPDVDLQLSTGGVSVHELLHSARGLLLNLNGSLGLLDTLDGHADRVDYIEAHSKDAEWPVPSLGEVRAPNAVLVRPDGHIAWIAGFGSEPDEEALRTALSVWFGQ